MPEVPPFTQELRLVHIDASPQPARYELWQWQPTLWGNVALRRISGTIGHPGRSRVLLETDTAQLSNDVRRAVQRRLRQGYQVVDWQ